MSKINKVKVDNVIYDIEDAEARELIDSLQTNVNGIKVPTKLSELENDKYYVSSADQSVKFNGRVHIYSGNVDGDGRKVDLLVEHIQGGGYGGYDDDLYINYRNSTDVRILEDGTGTLYYKNKEVATQEYVDEQISNIEVGGVDLSDYATKDYVDEQISNIEISGGSDYEDKYRLNEEIKTNKTWINGKPIYRQVLKGTKVSGTNLTWDLSAYNIEYIMHFDGSLQLTNTDGYQYPLNRYENSSTFTFAYYSPTEKKLSYNGGSSWCSGPVTIIIEYTKNTDTATITI